ncbi:MAG: hypothetical protein KGJ62_05390 [Armatimonadetes bacterium]|nr:hypothetical protein [Armatimonadota bacterium]MDE2206644.1 hypothetical protein [Armatimonadota bacterium]
MRSDDERRLEGGTGVEGERGRYYRLPTEAGGAGVPRRLITFPDSAWYYTPDHYVTFYRLPTLGP